MTASSLWERDWTTSTPLSNARSLRERERDKSEGERRCSDKSINYNAPLTLEVSPDFEKACKH